MKETNEKIEANHNCHKTLDIGEYFSDLIFLKKNLKILIIL